MQNKQQIHWTDCLFKFDLLLWFDLFIPWKPKNKTIVTAHNHCNHGKGENIFEQYFSEIPKDENWNFVEINSTNDLLAMANPHQKKYKTKQKTSKHGSTKNNWNLFKHKFPVFLNKSSEKFSQNNVH